MNSRAERWLAPVVLFILTGLLFSRSVTFEFLNWDDQLLLTENRWYLPLTLQSMWEMWNPLSLSRGTSLEYAPIRDMTYVLDLLAWGWSSFGFHLTQVVLHSVNAVLAFVVLHRFVGLVGAFAGAAFWAWHPLAVEPVAWISSRKDLLLGTFYFLTLLAFWSKRHRWAGVTGAAAILSKYAGGTVGVAALLLPSKESTTRGRIVAGGLVVGGILLIGFAIVANVGHETVVQVEQSAWPAGFQVFSHVATTFFFPVHLSARYLHHPEYGWTNGSVVIGFVLFLLYVGGVGFAWRRKSAFLSPLIFFGITLFPYLPFVPTNNWLADRYLYLPSFGMVWILAVLAEQLDVRGRGWGRATLVGAAVAAAFFTQARLPVWHDSITLWRDTVTRSPTIPYAWGNLGMALFHKGEFAEAVAALERAHDLNPNQPSVRVHLALAMINLGERERGREFLQEVEEVMSEEELVSTQVLRGRAWAQLGEMARAEALFRAQIERHPQDSNALSNLGILYAVTGRSDRALQLWEKALQFRPNLTSARLNRARYWFRQGECEQMETDLRATRIEKKKQADDRAWLRAHCE